MTISFTYVATVGHIISVQWYKDGLPLTDGTFDGVVISGASTTDIFLGPTATATLTILNPTAEYDGAYYAIVTDDDTEECLLATSPLEVEIPGLCRLVITVQPIAVETNAGSEIQLSVSFTGATNPAVQWYKDDVALVDGAYGSATVSGATTATLTITNAQVALTGNYYAIVTDQDLLDCLAQTNTVLVSINDTCALSITEQPESGDFTEGEEMVLTVAYANEVGTVTFQWYRNGVPLTDGPSGDATISGATTDTLTITNITSELAGNYTVELTDDGVDDCVTTSTIASITVEELTPPAGQFLWYKADADSLIYGQGAVAVPLFDYSGNNVHLSESANVPPYVWPLMNLNTKNGLAAWIWPPPITGNDANDVYTPLWEPTLPSFTGYSIAMVINRSLYNSAFASTIHATISQYDLAPNTSFPMVSSQTFSDGRWVLRGGAPPLYVFGSTQTPPVEVSVDEWQVVVVTIDHTEKIPRMWTNDQMVAGVAGTYTPTPFSRFDLQSASTDYIAEVLVYNYKLDTSDVAQLRNYLSAKWGIPITV